MRVHRIEFYEYEYRLGTSGGDWFLTPVTVKYIIADNTIDAVDPLRADLRCRVEIASIENGLNLTLDAQLVADIKGHRIGG